MKDPHEDLDGVLIPEEVAPTSKRIIRPPGGETDAWPPDRLVSMQELMDMIPYSRAEILWMIEHETFDPPFVDPTTMEMTWHGVSTWIEINRSDLPEPDDPSRPF